MIRRKETILTDYKSLKEEYKNIEYHIKLLRDKQYEYNKSMDSVVKGFERQLEAIRFTGTYTRVIESNIR